MRARIAIPKLTVIGAATALALVVAGCGGTTQTPTGGRATPKPSASAKATSTPTATSAPLTLAEASSPSYTVKIPLVPCSTLPANLQTAWGALLVGSSVNKCAPVNYLTTDVPQNVTVTNYDKSMTQAQANAYGQAMVTTLAWVTFAAYDDAPNILLAIGQGTGANQPMLQWEQSGAYVSSPDPGQDTFPYKIVILPLTSTEATIMANPEATFVIAVDFNQTPYGITWTKPGQSFTNYSNPPRLFTGTIKASPVLGTYFQVASYDNDCAIGPAVSLCQAAGFGS